MFRGDYPEHYLGGWATPAQLVSLGVLALGVVLWLLLPKPITQAAPRGGG